MFRNQTWSRRYGVMGDIAERAYETLMDQEQVPYVRYGFNRPPFSIQNLPPFIRYTPDYLEDGDTLVEVQGVGVDQIVKLKLDKMQALQAWDSQFMPVQLFVYDSHNKRCCRFYLADLTEFELDRFPEGKPYLAVHTDQLDDWEPTI